ncbi:S8 family serine peptidase [Georgenia ruanii]|uniref:S8 family serine peptidase n=2 Tax=Georgenia ruanii TaxID=348442 RepID=A0A7J9UT42_9MICO|nr:S8 family serine peptidase [Georgenia ruanii]
MRTVGLEAPLAVDAARDLAARLTASPQVLWAEPDYVVSLPENLGAIESPGTHVVDPAPKEGLTTEAVQLSPPWGLDRIDQRSGLNARYEYGTTGAGVTAYVVDTGIRASHQEFTGRVRPGFSAVADGRGTADCHGHGTHVAGTLGGTTYGVAKKVTFVPVRVLDCNGSGTISTVVSGIDWVVQDHPVGAPAVVNMSLGGPASDALDAAVRRLVADNITVVVASGNSGADACLTSPARTAEAITVNASTQTDEHAPFSNFGACTDIYAPGVGVRSAWASSDTAAIEGDGTSMATPHVAGVAARTLEANPRLMPAEVWRAIEQAATPVELMPVDGTDAGKLLYAAPTPAAPAPPGPGAAPGQDYGFFLNNSVTGTADVHFFYGDRGDEVLVGDWDGDGIKTPAVRRGATFYVRNSNTSGGADRVFTYGNPGDEVLVGDWDGDGTDTLAVRRGGTYFIRNSTTTGGADVVIAYGDPGDEVVVGDWDGNGSDSLGVRRGNQFYLRNTLTSGNADLVVGYGNPGDEVVVGDWDGNRSDSLGVRRGNQFYLRNTLTSGNADLVVGYGNPGDQALVGDWDGDRTDTLGVYRR